MQKKKNPIPLKKKIMKAVAQVRPRQKPCFTGAPKNTQIPKIYCWFFRAGFFLQQKKVFLMSFIRWVHPRIIEWWRSFDRSCKPLNEIIFFLDFKLSPCSECCIFLLGYSPASEFYMPAFGHTASSIFIDGVSCLQHP